MTSAPDRPKKNAPINKLPWDDLLEAFTRTGNDYGRKREIHEELRRRVSRGWQGNERIAPLRLFTQR
jgi:hypothetical protein